MVGAPQTEYKLGDGGPHLASLRQLLSEPLRPPALIPPETGPSGHPVWPTPAFCRPDRHIPLQYRKYRGSTFLTRIFPTLKSIIGQFGAHTLAQCPRVPRTMLTSLQEAPSDPVHGPQPPSVWAQPAVPKPPAQSHSPA